MNETDTIERDLTVPMQAEVDAEPATREAAAQEYPEGVVAAPLGNLDEGGIEMHILPVDAWRSSAQTALRSGDFETWAQSSLAGDDFERWLERDPTLGEIKAMFDVWGEKTGQSTGKSGSSAAFSRGTPRR